ncbi:MAG: tetratricopeptide repeat protein [Sideroxyarcus sp.]|nr:tetratricopeptide repeat protein [Sideroxyarcus sp.]
MSLLLDAMKKSGDNSQSTGLSNLSLEEHPAETQRASAVDSPASSSRAAGENLFAAKKKKEAPRRRWKLGLIPTTLLICSVTGGIYGYYVWMELNPPVQRVVLRPVAPPPSTPISTPAPPLVASIAPQTAPDIAPPIAEPAPEKSTGTNFYTEKPRPKSAARPRAPKSAAGMTIERQEKIDTLTPVLLGAYQAYQRGDYATASQGYREVLTKDERNRDALLGLGAIAQQQGQDQTAQHYYRQVLLLDPRDPVALGAMSAYRTSNGEDTESQLMQRLSEQPRSGALHYALGNVYAEQSRWAEAQQAYFNARMLEPSNAQFTYNLAVSLDHLGQSKLAAQYYQQALQLDAASNAGFEHAKAQQRLNELTASSR